MKEAGGNNWRARSQRHEIQKDLDPGINKFLVPDFGFKADLLHQELNNSSLWTFFHDYVSHNPKYERLQNLMEEKKIETKGHLL